MIRGDQHGAAGPHDGLFQPADAAIHRLNGLHRCRQIARVADHVAVGIVDDDQAEFARVDGCAELIGDLGR